MKTLALDARPAQRSPHSSRRMLELLYDAAVKEHIPLELWADGPLHRDCERFAAAVDPFPEAGATGEDTVMWCLTLERPLYEHRPYISMICDVSWLLPDGRSRLNRWRRGRAFRAKVKYAIRSCWRIATVSEDARRRLIAEFPSIEPKLFVVPLYAASSLRHVHLDEQEDVLKKYHLQPGYVLSLGSFRRHRNWQGLIEAYAQLPEALKEKHPLVFGGTIRQDKVNARRLIEQLGLHDRVHILGDWPEADLATLYSAADVFAFPSLMEGFGLPPLEAMQCGTPVVASNRTAIPEVLGEAAHYFDPEDQNSMTEALQQVLENEALRAEMSNAGLAHASEFNAARTGEVIKHVLEASGDGA